MATLQRPDNRPREETLHPEHDSAHHLAIPGGLTAWREQLVKQLILANLGERISVPQLARACALSRSHFSRAFKRTTGLSPQDWIHQQRIQQAKRLIKHSSLTLTQIGAACGFCDQAHFSRTFTRTEGLNPVVWRMSGGEDEGEGAVG